MSKADLLEVISSFPEHNLEEIIISSVREIFFSGDWGTANAIVQYILKSGGNNNFKVRIASFGIFMAVRARDINQALDRYKYLVMLNVSDKLIFLKADALVDLSDLPFTG